MSDLRDRSGLASRDLGAARSAYDMGDIEQSRAAHETKLHGQDEEHAG
jgi:hypothetical protein